MSNKFERIFISLSDSIQEMGKESGMSRQLRCLQSLKNSGEVSRVTHTRTAGSLCPEVDNASICDVDSHSRAVQSSN